MKFLFLLPGDAEAEDALSVDERRAIVVEHVAYAQMLRDLGVYVSGEALESPVLQPVRLPEPAERRPLALRPALELALLQREVVALPRPDGDSRKQERVRRARDRPCALEQPRSSRVRA